MSDTSQSYLIANGVFETLYSFLGDVDYKLKGIGRFGINLDTSYQSSYHSNERESRPKTKFFSLLIYAGYPIIQGNLHK